MSDFISILLLPPIFRGFIGMMISGACFPVCGVIVVRMGLIPLRYMLMHGVILGGAIAIASSLPLIPVIIIVNIILVFLMISVSKNQSFSFSGGSAAIMVISMAFASLISHIKNIPSKDSLNILWGSPFTLMASDIIILVVVSVLMIIFIIFNFNKILAFFYNVEIAVSIGFKKDLFYDSVIIITAFIVALGMKLLGAFLIDSLLILPVLCSASILHFFRNCNGIRKLFIISSITGFIFSVIGYLAAVKLDFPPSAVIALLSGSVFVFTRIVVFILKIFKVKSWEN